MKAVIPAAGLGTRFLPYTKSQPKEMLPVVDKPAIQYVVEEAVAAEIREILIVTGKGKRAIEDHFDVQKDLELELKKKGLAEELAAVQGLSRLARILYVRQGEPLGLGHALLAAERYVGGEPFAVMLGDDICIHTEPCIGELKRLSQEFDASVIAVSRVVPERVPMYGMVVGEEVRPGVLEVRDIVEKPRREETRSNVVTIGRYCLKPEIWPALHTSRPDQKGEIQLTPALRELVSSSRLYAWVFPGERFDIGDKVDWIRATIRVALERPGFGDAVRQVLKDCMQDRKPHLDGRGAQSG